MRSLHSAFCICSTQGAAFSVAQVLIGGDSLGGGGHFIPSGQRMGGIHQGRPAAHLHAHRQHRAQVFARGTCADQRLDVEIDARLAPLGDGNG